jgi:hypothetical protein
VLLSVVWRMEIRQVHLSMVFDVRGIRRGIGGRLVKPRTAGSKLIHLNLPLRLRLRLPVGM